MKEFIVEGRRVFLVSNAFFALNFLGNLILVRMLSPEEFGTIALALSLIGLIEIGTTFSIGTVYQQRRSSPSLLTAVAQFTGVVLIIKLVAALLVFGVMGSKYDERIWTFFAIIFLSKLLVPATGLLNAIMDKELKFLRATFIVNGCNLAGMFSAILAVAAGAGAYGLLFREVLPNTLAFAVSVYFSRHLDIRWRDVNRRQLKLVAAGALQMFGVRASELAFARVPMLVVQHNFGTEALGLLTQALYLVGSVNRITSVVTMRMGVVLFNLFRKDAERTRQGQLAMLVFTAALAIPALLVFFFFPEPLVSLLWGSKWLPSAPMLKWLSFCVLLMPLFTILRAQLYGRRMNTPLIVGYLVAATVFICVLFVPPVTLGLPASSIIAAAVVSGYAVVLLLAWAALRNRGSDSGAEARERRRRQPELDGEPAGSAQ